MIFRAAYAVPKNALTMGIGFLGRLLLRGFVVKSPPGPIEATEKSLHVQEI